MSEKILKALMQLFAIIANRDQLTGGARNIVETFLRQQVTQVHFAYYLGFFDDYLLFLQGKASSGKAGKRLAANSVKVLKICTQINSELDQKQKYVVLLKLIEFAYSFDEAPGEQELEFIDTVGSVFNIEKEVADQAHAFASATNLNSFPDSPEVLVINSLGKCINPQAKTLVNETLEGDLVFLHIRSEGMIFVRYFGNSVLMLNGQPMTSNRVHVFTQGSVIRESKMQAVYYSDIIKSFLDYSQDEDIAMTVNQVEFFFKNGHQGMHAISFAASSGNLVGIMGGSGAGKSTLLNILNGNLTPQKGEVLINGVNIHKNRKELQGVIGYIPQDDLLMEELSVYQNLFYNSKLGLGNLSDEEIDKLVNELLDSLGLTAIKDLKVGDPLNKTVSGGQRKRLNIALELIRKPSVLFVDEPTSGLSSLDSQNVMDLLKQLTLAGKLIYVVIHQPSSDIFKLFDKMLILDTGGYPVYYGNPSDSVIYFKKRAHLAAADKSECETCGNINPEQIFSIIESKVFNEYGQPTPNRKITPKEWYEYYEENRLPNVNSASNESRQSSAYDKPSLLRQIKVFIQRDVLSKLKNSQYLLINFLEAPVLAFILAYFLKYAPEGTDYIFRENLNLPAYIFMGVIVSLFMGLTVSAEEIIRDQKILKREEFLSLSRGGYLLSKMLIMFTISAIQTFTFVIIGNSIFEIQGMYTDYWLMLFTVSCFGNLMGLNISAAFNSAVTIYILIPFLIIPQIILSGVMVKFENLNPTVTNRTRVPFIGEIMASRWAYEALAVNQYRNNEYEKNFFTYDQALSEIVYRKDFWMVKMNDLADSLHNGKAQESKLALLRNELDYAVEHFEGAKNASSIKLTYPLQQDNYMQVKDLLSELKKQFIGGYKSTSAIKDAEVQRINKEMGRDYLNNLRESNTNDNLGDMLSSTNDFEFIIEDNNRFIRRFRPVYMWGEDNSFVRAQFYVSSKNVFGKHFSTWMVNTLVIWCMTLLLTATLYHNSLRKLLAFFSHGFPKKLLKKK